MSKSRLAKTSAIVAAQPERVAIDVARARDLLAASKTIAAAKSIHDRGKGLEALLRAQKSGSDAVNEAIEVQLWAARRVGELLRELPKATGTRGAGRPPIGGSRGAPPKSAPTLAEQGLDKKTAHRCQKLAEQPERDFADVITAIRARGEKLTAAGVITSASAHPDYDGDESYTPVVYIEAARKVMGSIDCDPASSSNKLVLARIGAKHAFTKEMDGLHRHWVGNVWLNPPYSAQLIKEFVAKLLEELATNTGARTDLDQAVVLTNAATDAAWWQSLAQACSLVCMVAGRIGFDQPHPKKPGELRETKNNRYAQSFFYFGNRAQKFREEFQVFGVVGALRVSRS